MKLHWITRQASEFVSEFRRVNESTRSVWWVCDDEDSILEKKVSKIWRKLRDPFANLAPYYSSG